MHRMRRPISARSAPFAPALSPAHSTELSRRSTCESRAAIPSPPRCPAAICRKLILGREFDRSPVLLIANQPTWGVDAGAAARIRQEIIDLARGGAGVLVISQDLDELLEISDRIAVMSDGTLSRTVPAETVTRETLGLMMGGTAPDAHHDERIAEMDAAGEI
jgi:hypothetical protein